ncbi:MAG: hypothetical protein IKO61_10405 [Lachnospiraceae bacterium]|nr:hypothetical protein [Lachnospiraceae bacterium]
MKILRKIFTVMLTLCLVICMCVVTTPATVKAETVSQATSIEVGLKYTGNCNYNNKKVYKFTLKKSGLIYFNNTDYESHGDKIYLYFYHEEDLSNYLGRFRSEYNDNIGYYVANNYDYVYLMAGTYYLIVETDSDTNIAFAFKMNYKSANESFAETYSSRYDVISNAKKVNVDTWYRGVLSDDDNIDMYKFTVPNKQTVKVTFKALEGDYRLYGYFISSDGKEITCDNSKAGESGAGEISSTLEAGTYYVKFESNNGFYKFRITPCVSVSYSTFVQSYGWRPEVSNGAFSGTSGQKKRLEALKIRISEKPYKGSVMYNAYVQKIGWQGWKSNGAVAGTTNKGYRTEAIKVQLSKDMKTHYDIYYRVYIQKIGWSGWAKNGNPAGSAGFAYRLEGMQVKILPKGSAAPGSSKKAYTTK